MELDQFPASEIAEAMAYYKLEEEDRIADEKKRNANLNPRKR